jgi:pimeloyl-ACP methyl ester carboxylesterase
MALWIFAASLSLASVAPVFVEKPCSEPKLDEIARCGTVNVPEDREDPDGRFLSLNVIVLPATTAHNEGPPLFDIDGGPGLPGTKNAEFYATFGAAYRARRDVVLVDQRGTGQSNPLHCPELSAPERVFEPMWPVAMVRRCRESLEKSADLARYGTREAVEDLDIVRRALGYNRIDLFGMSYGSTVALRYMATFPGRTRAAVLMGVAPASTMPPRAHATAGARALNLLYARCSADPDCSAAFDPAAAEDAVRGQLAEVPGAPPLEIFFEKLRSLMYAPGGARHIPKILHRAARGDLEPFYALTRPQLPNLHADGMFLSVICTESMALMDVEQARAASRSTILGDYRLRTQENACAGWPIGKVPDDHLAPVRSDAQVLMLSGELDPVTPPELADLAAETLPNAVHVVIPGSGHIFDGMSGIEECLDPMIVGFLDSGNARSIDSSCVRDMRPPPFVLDDSARSDSEPQTSKTNE